MEITWHGLSCFRLTERGQASIVTDPYDEGIGYPPLKLRADIVTVSHDAPGHSNVKAVRGVQRAITGPGEYEIGGVFVIGVAMINPRQKKNENRPRNVVYLFDFDGLSVLHLGDLNYTPNQSEVDQLGAVDVALVPVGGGAGLDSAKAAEVISLLEPSIVVPMHYKTPEVNLKLSPVSKFLKEMGVTSPREDESLKVTRADLPEQTQVVILTHRNQPET
jgi:L-ascorbate metabolism protein UlaG (beta-lactamase superfamily)